MMACTCKSRHAQAAQSQIQEDDAMDTINTGDTAWLLISSALVLMMTPALAFFYGGVVRKKNILSTLNLSFIMMCLISLQWLLYGYSLAFGSDVGGIIGGLDFLGF